MRSGIRRGDWGRIGQCAYRGRFQSHRSHSPGRSLRHFASLTSRGTQCHKSKGRRRCCPGRRTSRGVRQSTGSGGTGTGGSRFDGTASLPRYSPIWQASEEKVMLSQTASSRAEQAIISYSVAQLHTVQFWHVASTRRVQAVFSKVMPVSQTVHG